ncbi:MAG: methyltransferase, partial [Candidatus Obscuribacterales bacterium]|nr:methyltransferase [Steroidobacteraceae bacterium]
TGKVYIQNPPRVLQMRGGAAEKALVTRLAGNRLPNAVRADGDLPVASIPDNSADFAITAMNLHDVYNLPNGATIAQGLLKNVYSMLKPGGVFGVMDHAGVAAGDNTNLHRMQKQQAIDVAKAAGFVVDAESNLLANASDDHTKMVFDPTLRGKTDQFVLRLRKPK